MEKIRFSSGLVSIILLAVLLLTPAIVNATDGISVIYGPEKISTGGDEETPQVAVDSKGNAHIVWSSSDGTYLFYKMVDSYGNVLIDETNLNPCQEPTTRHVRRPSIVVDSDGCVHVVFHGFSLYQDFGPGSYCGRIGLDASEVIYLKINPYLDDRSGDAADFYTITVIPERIISTEDSIKSHAPNIAIDPLERLHVVWYDGQRRDSIDIHYLVMDVDGNTLVGEKIITTGLYIDVDWGEPEIATDPDGNAHIVYCNSSRGSSAREIYYTMINGDTGDTLIDDTRITADDGHASVRAFLAVDSNGMIHIVWHDRRLYDEGTGEHELFYSKLNPSLDDQDGSPADPTVISVISETMITSNDGYRSYLKNIAIDPEDRVHITWVDMYGYNPEEEWGAGEIYYQLRSADGEVIIPETRITYFNGEVYPAYWWYSSGRNPDIAVTRDRAFIVFNGYKKYIEYVVEEDASTSEIEEDTSDIYLIILSLPLPVGGRILAANTLTLAAPYLLIMVLVIIGLAGILFKRRIS